MAWKMSDIVDVADIPSWLGKEREVGVNWSAIGPVSPAFARRFAAAVIKSADLADKLKAKYKKRGIKVVNP